MIRKAERSEATKQTVVEVGDVRFGHDPFPVIAGPCVIEDEQQITANRGGGCGRWSVHVARRHVRGRSVPL